MKKKKLSTTMILLAVTIIAYIAVTLLWCYTTKPAVTKGEFPFSITYEYKGETKTLTGVYECEYSGSRTIQGDHDRHWDGQAHYDNPVDAEYPNIIEQNDELLTTLAIQENMYAGYFMGDPLHKDYYQTYGYQGPEPEVEYYDYKNEIYLDEENKEEVLESIDFKIVDFTYAEPIENSFSFSGIQYEADNVMAFVAILLAFLLLCLICVRKDKEYKYSKLDKVGILWNFLIGILAVPFISISCMLFGIVGSNVELVEQIIYNVPSITILCLALSIVFRRRGYSKPGFFIQFGGVVLFVVMLILDTIL